MENLGATTSALDQGYVGELVAALRVGYWVHKELEVAVKALGSTRASRDRPTTR